MIKSVSVLNVIFFVDLEEIVILNLFKEESSSVIYNSNIAIRAKYNYRFILLIKLIE